MSSFSLSNVLEFTKLLNTFQEVERGLYVVGKDRKENDVEHSYQLAMLSWYIATNIKPDLEISRVIKYALVHDLVEVYAGDTFLWSKDESLHNSKHEREEVSRLRIEKELPMFPELHQIIMDYENKEDEESKFVYVLDKIHPVIQIYLDEGRMWKEKEITLEMLLTKKKDKLQLAEELRPMWDELEEVLTKKEKELF